MLLHTQLIFSFCRNLWTCAHQLLAPFPSFTFMYNIFFIVPVIITLHNRKVNVHILLEGLHFGSLILKTICSTIFLSFQLVIWTSLILHICFAYSVIYGRVLNWPSKVCGDPHQIGLLFQLIGILLLLLISCLINKALGSNLHSLAVMHLLL